MSAMTTPQQFQANVLASLQYLDQVLPKGSHVAFLGLADGRVLYETTQNRTHPLGVGYPGFYDYLTCNNANPCNGWLTSNATFRNATSERAAELTATYDAIIAQNSSSFHSFDMYRLQVDWNALIQDYINSGQDAMNIIEPVDGEL
jgi:acyloxyacyl hydrolase